MWKTRSVAFVGIAYDLVLDAAVGAARSWLSTSREARRSVSDIPAFRLWKTHIWSAQTARPARDQVNRFMRPNYSGFYNLKNYSPYFQKFASIPRGEKPPDGASSSHQMRIGLWRNNRGDGPTDINDFALSQDSFFGKLASIFMGAELRERATKARLLFMFP